MSDYPDVYGARPGDPQLRLRLAALTAVIIGVVLVALAAFLFSYAGIRQIALQAGVSPGLARLYPLMFDAMLVVACSGVLATRAAGWGTKSFVWVCLLLVVGAVAVGNALYSTGVHLTGQPARAAIAVIPWVLLLLGFGIWLLMLRHWRRIRTSAVDEAEAGRAAQAGRNGHAGRSPAAVPARQPDGAPQADRAAQAMAASAAAGGAVTWAAGRGGTPARTRAPRVGIDTLLEQQASRAPERPPAEDSPAAASRTAAAGQGKQRTAPGERQAAGTTAAAGTVAAAGAAAGIAAAAGARAGTRGDGKPGTTGETRPGTAARTSAGTPETAGTAPGIAGTAPGTTGTASGTAGTTPGTAATTPGMAGAAAGTAGAAAATAGAAAARAGTAGSAEPAGTGPDGGGKGKGKAPAQERRRRLGGLLEMPADGDDEEGSVQTPSAKPTAEPGDTASGEDGEADTPAGLPAGAAAPDPADPPAPLPHFDRPRSTPTPPQETGADGE